MGPRTTAEDELGRGALKRRAQGERDVTDYSLFDTLHLPGVILQSVISIFKSYMASSPFNKARK